MSATMSAPGVTFQFVDLNRPALARLRTDICGMVLFAERGPLERAVKVTSWRQFLDTFGPPLDFAHGGHAARLYFENGGAALHAARVADPDTARAARVTLETHGAAAGSAITLRAGFSGIAQPVADDPGPLASPTTDSADNPGTWGNRLAVAVQSGGLGVAESLPNQPADGASIRVNQVAGFFPGSWVRLVQDGKEHDTYACVSSIDPILGEITWHTPVTGPTLDYSAPVRLETVEFTLLVTLDTIEVARIDNLSLDPDHPRFLPLVLQASNSFLAAEVATAGPLSAPGEWPAPGLFQPFAGGADGLATAGKTHFLKAFEVLEKVDEIAVLCAPDLVLQAQPDSDPPAAIVTGDICHLGLPLPRGSVRGRVISSETGAPIAGVTITSPDASSRRVLSDGDGIFLLDGLPVGQAVLILEKDGFLDLELTVQTFEYAPSQPQDFALSQRQLPVPLGEDEVFAVQQAMLAQGEMGHYRVALLDPPATRLKIEDVQSWRNRFDSSYGALYWPWLRVVAPGETLSRALPPSGAVAGLLARMDLSEGPQRAVANRTLRGVQALTDAVDKPTHGMLNDQGINVLLARPGRGIAPMGARTLSSDSAWRYLGVRRLMLMIAEAIEDGHQWAVFEPNNRVLRDALMHSLRAFLGTLWRGGAFAGASPEAAFAVKCDEENNPPAVVDAGQLVCDIAVAPVRPFEFIRLRLGRTDRLQVQVQE